jgi:post-segregation antitoxin (ccd killing protein)
MSAVSLPIVCAWCERVRTTTGRWLEANADPIADDATHGICPDCLVAQTREAGAAVACR